MDRQNAIQQQLGTILVDLLAQNLTKPNLKVHNRTDATLYGLTIMAIRVVEFSNGGYKIRKIFA